MNATNGIKSGKSAQYVAVDKAGNVVEVGDTVTDFRGETATYTGCYMRPAPSTGRVTVTHGPGSESSYYPSVFGLTVIEAADAAHIQRHEADKAAAECADRATD